MDLLYIIAASIFAFTIVFYIPAYFYIEKGLFNKLFHDVARWHQPDFSTMWSDGHSQHAKCKWCGKDITQRKHGMWF